MLVLHLATRQAGSSSNKAHPRTFLPLHPGTLLYLLRETDPCLSEAPSPNWNCHCQGHSLTLPRTLSAISIDLQLPFTSFTISLYLTTNVFLLPLLLLITYFSLWFANCIRPLCSIAQSFGLIGVRFRLSTFLHTSLDHLTFPALPLALVHLPHLHNLSASFWI